MNQPLATLTPPPQSHHSRPHLALTLGDPAGIGPEVALKALLALPSDWPGRITVVGDRRVLAAIAPSLGPAAVALLPHLTLVEPWPGVALPHWGMPTAAAGAACFQWLQRAIAGCLTGEFDGIVTGPIAKAVWHQAGHSYPGQTEVLAQGAGVTRYGMAFVGRSPHTQWCLRAILATTHIPLAQVPAALNPDLLDQKLDLLLTCLHQDFGITHPTVALAGLNPHAGEGGQLGREEVDWLHPWAERARSRYPHLTLTDPLPPDTLWVSAGQAWYRDATASPYHAYLALYHDQGLIPVKLLAFDRAVNTTLGLPFVRTSPDHGTAFDIAGQGIADPTSLLAALDLALEQVNQRFRFRNFVSQNQRL